MVVRPEQPSNQSGGGAARGGAVHAAFRVDIGIANDRPPLVAAGKNNAATRVA
jgi:hypothetical protein